MLNAPLFEKLQSLIPRAWSVVRENAPATVAFRESGGTTPLTRKDPEAVVQVWGEVYKANCPGCGDTKKRLFVSHISGQHVTIGNVTSRIGWIYVCHNEHCRLQELNPMALAGMPMLELTCHEGSCTHAFLHDKCKLGKEYKMVDSPDTPVEFTEYLTRRGFNPAELAAQYHVGYAAQDSWWFNPTTAQKANGIRARKAREPRIVIPIYQHGFLVGFQARRIDAVSEQKYLNQPESMQKARMLYNLDTALLQREVVVVEGVTDVWKVGPRGVATFGRNVSEWQRWALSTGWRFDGMGIILPDANDPKAMPEALELQAFLVDKQAFPRGCHILQLQPGTDPGAYDQTVLREYIEGSIAYHDNHV